MLNRPFWRRAVLAAVGIAAGASLASCEMGPEVTPAKFATRPTAADIQEAYPGFAKMARIPGKVRMRCYYSLDGLLERCRKLGVAPEGLNFDRRVPTLLGKYVVTPQTIDGRPAPSAIDFVISFNPSPAPGAYNGQPVTEAEVAALKRRVSLNRTWERSSAQYVGSRTVELDRSAAVAAIIDRAYADDDPARRDALMLGVVQAMTPADRRLISTSQYFAIPGLDQIETVSPEYHAAAGRLADRMRAEYCAAYSCDATLPPAPEGP